MKFFFNKNENGEEIAEEIVMVRETLDVPSIETEKQEIASVIALALALHANSVQEEETVMTSIQRFMNLHSPWSDKTHVLRQLPLYFPNQNRK